MAKLKWELWMLQFIEQNYNCMFNEDMAKALNVSPRTVIRKMRELGLYRSKDFLAVNRAEITKRLRAAKPWEHPNVKKNNFKKGVRQNPATEFKKGTQNGLSASEELRAKALETRRKNKVSKEVTQDKELLVSNEYKGTFIFKEGKMFVFHKSEPEIKQYHYIHYYATT